MATVMPRLEGVRLVVYSFHVDTAVAHTLPLATGCFWPRVCKNTFLSCVPQPIALGRGDFPITYHDQRW